LGDDYFDPLMANRQVMFWVVATRQQLDRWEPLVACFVRESWSEPAAVDGALVWRTNIEHHFALIAVRNLLRALALLEPPFKVSEKLAAELIAGRDLHEHWVENMPIFNRRPRTTEPPRKSGQSFAARNPDRSPYLAMNWNSKAGPLLLPSVPASEVHSLLDDAQQAVLRDQPEFSSYLLPRPEESPWEAVERLGRWWPRQTGPPA
jgi:hypothetical protein